MRALTLFPLISVMQDTGAARTIDFKCPVGCRIVKLEASADACDSTDKPTIVLKSGATTLYSVGPITSPNTPFEDVEVATGLSDRFSEGDQLALDISFAGTASNVRGIYAVVWATAKPR